MNEEMNTNEVTKVEANEVEVIDMPEESGNNGIIGKVLLGAGVALIGGGIALWKNRHKIKARRNEKAANKLRKNGYTVTKTVYLDNDEAEYVEIEEDVQETEE
jgi:hypothetical protein